MKRGVWLLVALLGACSKEPGTPSGDVQLQTQVGSSSAVPVVTGDVSFVEIDHFGGAPLTTQGETKDVAVSPDGKIIVCGGGPKGSLLLWDADSGKRIGTLESEDGAITVPAFSPDGKKVAAVVNGSGILIWNVASRAIDTRLQRPQGAQIFALDYDPMGRFLATSDGSGRVELWDATQPGTPRLVEDNGSFGSNAAFSPDGKTLVTANDKGSALASFDVASTKRKAVLARGVKVRRVAFSGDGKQLVTAETLPDGSEVAVSREANGKAIATLRGHTRHVNAVAMTRDGTRVLSGSGDGTVRVWESATGKQLQSLETSGQAVWELALFADGGRVVAAGQGNVLHLFRLPSGERIHKSGDHAGAVDTVAYARDGSLLASGDTSGRVLVRRLSDGTVVRLPELGRFVASVGFSPDGARLFTIAGRDVRFWDPNNGEPSGSPMSLARSGALVFSPDGRYLATSDESRIVTLLDAATGAKLRTFGEARPGDDVRQNLMTPSSVSFSPKGEHIAIARWDQPVQIWNVQTGELVRSVPGTLFVSYSPNGKHLATGHGEISKRSERPSLALVDATSGTKLHELDGDARAAFSTDGRWLFALRDGELRAWDTDTGRLVARTPSHGATSFAVSADGRRIATGAMDGSVHEWRVEPRQE